MLHRLFGSSRPLHTHLALVFVGLFAVIQLIAFVVMDRGRARVAQTHVDQELAVGERMFERLLSLNREQLERAAGILAADYGFRAAIATNDLNTSLSVLRNHGDRIDASVMQLISLDGRIIADTKGHRAIGDTFRSARLFAQAEASGQASSIVVMADGLAYQLVVVPVRAPDIVAWVAMGFLLNDRHARDLRDTINLDVSFAHQGTPGQWRLLASSLGRATGGPLIDVLKGSTGAASAGGVQADPLSAPQFAVTQFVVDLPEGRYESRLVPLETGSTGVVAVLHRSIEAAMRPFELLGRLVLGMAVAGLLAFAFGSVMVSRAIARPVNALAEHARRIEGGDYAAPPAVQSTQEIEGLARSIDRMRVAVSEREESIRHLAYHDPLTGLANRARLIDRLDQLIALSGRQSPMSEHVAVLLMDLDRFKHVNDVLGHQHGDVVLQEVARRLTTLLRDSDTVARLGGDEFAVLLPKTAATAAAAVAARINAALEPPIAIEGQNVDIGASIGVAAFPEHGTSAATLLREADVAMYAAKRARAGVMIFSERHSHEQQRQLSLLSDVRRAIDEDQLVLHYQPKIEIGSMRVIGVEALVRWQHPERGNIPPGEFIPFLEQSGHIRSLTRWALRAGIRQIAQWNRQGRHLVAAINITARDLLNPDLPRHLDELLAEHGVAPAQLCLELTESGLMEDPVTALATMERLHAAGVRLAIDDYGSGYSSLAYVQRLPVGELKIDRTFVGRLTADRDSQTIVHSTIELGHNLGLQVTAEGIEDAQALQMLRDMGCDTGQGYFIARPLAADAFDRWWLQLAQGAAAGAFALSCAAAQAGTLFDAQAGVRYDSNLPRAQLERDIRSDSAATAALQWGRFVPLGTGLSLTATLDAGAEAHRRFEGLDALQLGATLGARRKFGLGALAPWIGTSASVTRLDYRDRLRDGWRYDVGIAAGKRLVETWDVRADLRQSQRRVDRNEPAVPWISGEVHDLQARQASVQVEFTATERLALAAGVAYRRGEVASTTQRNFTIFTHSDAIAADPVFGPEAFGYRIHAVTRSARLAASLATGESGSINFSVERAVSRGRGGLDYFNTLMAATYAYRH